MSQLVFGHRIYNSRNYIWLIALLQIGHLSLIYNSRNYIWLIAATYLTSNSTKSTIVEITFGL